MKRILLVSVFLMSMNCFGSGFRAYYVTIDSVTKDYIGRDLCFDLKSKTMAYYGIDTLFFTQLYIADSVKRFHTLLLEPRDTNQIYFFRTLELIDVTEDSIYCSAQLVNFEKVKPIIIEISSFAIPKSHLNGIIFGPTNKQVRSFFAVGGILTILSIIFIAFGGG